MFGEEKKWAELSAEGRGATFWLLSLSVCDELPAGEGEKAHTPLSVFNPIGYSHSGVIRRAFVLYFRI